jgi:hypothetical protein
MLDSKIVSCIQHYLYIIALKKQEQKETKKSKIKKLPERSFLNSKTYYLTAALKSDPALNVTTFIAGILIFLEVS